ncbi:hypothetical protein V8D89_002655 [Ganoderma adspersum]
MASQDSALIDAVSNILATQTSTFAMLALVVYDWLINLDEEIRCFWTFRKGRVQPVATLLYMLSRYLSILIEVLELQTVVPLSDMACKANFYAQNAINIPLLFTPAVFTAIRVYALSQNNKVLAISTFAVLFGPTFSVAVVNAMSKPGVLPSPFNCSIIQSSLPQEASNRLCVLTRQKANENIVNVAGTVINVIGDLLALFVTWRKTYTIYKSQRGVLRGPSLMRVMLYNGSIYFLVITGMNILNLILYQISSGALTYAGIITSPLSIVLTCRFLLDLRQADRTANAPPSLGAVPSLNFDVVDGGQTASRRSLPAFVASMGSEVHTGLDFVDEIARNPEAAANEGTLSRD